MFANVYTDQRSAQRKTENIYSNHSILLFNYRMKPIFTSQPKDLSPHFLSRPPEANTVFQLNWADTDVNDPIDVTSGIWLAFPVNI